MLLSLRNALSGVVATLVGMAGAHLVAALGDPATSPVLAVGSTVIDLTPTPIKEWAVSTFGTYDKPLLVGSVLLVTLLLAGAAGVLAARRFALGAGLLVLLTVAAGAAAVLRPASGVLDALPALVAALLGVGALWWFHRSGSESSGAHAEKAASSSASGPGRRAILIGAGVAAVLGTAGQWLASARTRIADVMLPEAARQAEPLPTGLEEKYAGISPLQTPNDDFYRVDTRLSLPVIDLDSWSLTIDGDVENELTFSFDDLLAMELVERDITMTCVSNEVGGPYVGAARWLGVPLERLLEEAGVGDTADQILSTDVDGFTISTPLEVALDGREPLVAVGMNGEPLPQAHGFPVRLVTPGIYGFVGSTKWLTRITLTTYEAEQAYWTERDWATDAPIKISSRIDTPKPLSTQEPGKVIIGGVAWAQQRGVAQVEVRIDGGSWEKAELGPDVNVDYWRQWYYEWEADSGSHMLAVRAITDDGDVQTPARTTPFPEGSSGIQEIVVNVS